MTWQQWEEIEKRVQQWIDENYNTDWEINEYYDYESAFEVSVEYELELTEDTAELTCIAHCKYGRKVIYYDLYQYSNDIDIENPEEIYNEMVRVLTEKKEEFNGDNLTDGYGEDDEDYPY